MTSPTEKIPSALAEKFAATTAFTDTFCDKHLNDEYRAEQVQADRGGVQDGADVARMDIARPACR